MIEIEPTIDNVREGDVVTIETGTPGEPGHNSITGRIVSAPHMVGASHDFTLGRVQKLTEPGGGWKITRITRPSLPIPDGPGERFWARWRSTDPREYIVAEGDRIVDLTDGGNWERDLFERRHTVVPTPEPETVPVPADLIREAETVPVPADLIREAEEWDAGNWSVRSGGESILSLIVRAVRERKEKSDD